MCGATRQSHRTKDPCICESAYQDSSGRGGPKVPGSEEAVGEHGSAGPLANASIARTVEGAALCARARIGQGRVGRPTRSGAMAEESLQSRRRSDRLRGRGPYGRSQSMPISVVPTRGLHMRKIILLIIFEAMYWTLPPFARGGQQTLPASGWSVSNPRNFRSDPPSAKVILGFVKSLSGVNDPDLFLCSARFTELRNSGNPKSS
jgi:hypothetical protein